jgi:hypothetical protein
MSPSGKVDGGRIRDPLGGVASPLGHPPPPRNPGAHPSPVGISPLTGDVDLEPRRSTIQDRRRHVEGGSERTHHERSSNPRATARGIGLAMSGPRPGMGGKTSQRARSSAGQAIRGPTSCPGGPRASPTARRGLARSYRGRGPRNDDARAAHCRGEAAACWDPSAPRQHWTRALLASPGTVGSPTREDRPAPDGPDVAGVSPGLSAVSSISGRAAA